MKSSRVVLLLSGGMESLVVAAMFRKSAPSWLGHAFFVDYGQRAVERELQAVTQISRAYALQLEKVTLDVPFLSAHPLVDADAVLVDEALGAKGLNSVTNHIVPGRNLMLLGCCVTYAMSIGASEIWTGFDFTPRPGAAVDKSEVFVLAMHGVMAAIGAECQIVTPLQGSTKEATARIGQELEVDWASSWSCYNAFPKPCGVCAPCRARRKALEQVGVQQNYHSTEYVTQQMDE